MIVMAMEITELMTISQDRVDWGAGFLVGMPCKDIDFTVRARGKENHWSLLDVETIRSDKARMLVIAANKVDLLLLVGDQQS
jgi:galactokinase